MSDNVPITAGAGTSISTDDLGANGHAQRFKLLDATDGSTAVAPGAARAATGTLSNVASSATSVTLLAANTSRLGAIIANDSTAVLYVKLAAAAASASSYTVKMQPDGYYEVPSYYSGEIRGIWASANGNARITELT